MAPPSDRARAKIRNCEIVAAVRKNNVGFEPALLEAAADSPPPERMTELLDLANDSIILCDAQGTITYWNRGSQRIYGWTREEALGQNLHALLKTVFSEGTPDLEETLRAQSHWEGELEQIGRNGSTVHVASHWTLKNESGNSSSLLINSDISARKKAEEDLRRSEERLRRFVEEDLTGNLIIRPDGEILTCNPAFVRIFEGFRDLPGDRQRFLHGDRCAMVCCGVMPAYAIPNRIISLTRLYTQGRGCTFAAC